MNYWRLWGIWFASGLLGSWVMLTFNWPYDVTVRTAIFALAMALLGPANMLAALLIWSQNYFDFVLWAAA